MTWTSEIDPSKWDEKKIKLYRASLHRHHGRAIEQEKDLGRTAVGLISVIAVVWSIIGVYATTQGGSLVHSIRYCVIVMSLLFVIAIILFMKVLNNPPKPSIFFSAETPHSIEKTVNIGTIGDFNLFNETMLRYEIHAYNSQLTINKFKNKLMLQAISLTLSGIILFVMSILIVFS